MYKRLFLAIPILPEIKLQKQKEFLINNLKEEMINWVKDENMHLTLKFIGKTPTQKIPEIIEAVNPIISRNPFPMILEKVGIFGSSYQAKVVWIGIQQNNELLNFQKVLAQQLEKIGYSIDRQNFVPHFTLGRIKKIINKDHFKRVMDDTEKGFIQEFWVDKFLLYESILTTDGPIYKIIKKFELAEA